MTGNGVSTHVTSYKALVAAGLQNWWIAMLSSATALQIAVVSC
jgi:hypothetical protein